MVPLTRMTTLRFDVLGSTRTYAMSSESLAENLPGMDPEASARCWAAHWMARGSKSDGRASRHEPAFGIFSASAAGISDTKGGETISAFAARARAVFAFT